MDKFGVISFPRSGQYLFQDILKYVCANHDLEYKFCSFYNCCNQIPCSKGGNFMKNHDHDNKLLIDKDKKYIVLYRNDIILQLESYYRYYTKKNGLKYTLKKLRQFILNNKKYYIRFKYKWVSSNLDNVLKIEYYDLVKNPIENIRKTFKFLYPDLVLKDEIINEIPNIEFDSQGKKSKICIQNTLDEKTYKIINSYIFRP